MKNKFYQGNALDKELRALYEVKGKLPDMKHIEYRRHRRITRALIMLVLFFAVLTAASWTGFLLFGGGGGSGGEVTIQFDAPEAVVSGVPQTLTMHVKNLDREPLAFATLRLRPPEHVRVETALPKPREEGGLLWEFGTIPARETRDVTLTVVPYGALDETLDLTGIVSYKPGNFNAEFQTSSTHTFTVRASSVAIEIEGVPEATPGQLVKMHALIRNQSDQTFERVGVALKLPPTFVLSSEDGAAFKGGVYELGTLEPGAQKDFSFSGSMLSTATGAQEIGFIVETQQQGIPYPIGKGIYTIAAKNSPLKVGLMINENPDLTWVRLGDSLAVKVTIENTQETPIQDLRLMLHTNGGLVDTTKTVAQDGVITPDQIVWGAKAKLLTLAAKERKEFVADLVIFTAPSKISSPAIALSADIEYGDIVIKSLPRSIAVVSDLVVQSEARYFGADGKAVGTGPLPPKAGEDTKYEIRFRLRNTFHDLSDLVVTVPLPQGVHFGSAVSTQWGRLNYQDAVREVRWEIPRLPVTVQDASVSFTIIAQPTAADQGKLIALLGVTRVEALDTITQVRFSADTPSLSSGLEADPYGKGKGVVQ